MLNTAIKAAKADKKPIEGTDRVKLAHLIMLPFRGQLTPLIEGEELPDTLDLPSEKAAKEQAEKDKAEQREITRSLLRNKGALTTTGKRFGPEPGERKELISNRDLARKPESPEAFEKIFHMIEDERQKLAYYKKWSKEWPERYE